jgi:hypothetical protein
MSATTGMNAVSSVERGDGVFDVLFRVAGRPFFRVIVIKGGGTSFYCSSSDKRGST